MFLRRKVSGFTIIELMVTLAVLVIVAASAAPAFQDVLAANRVTSQANTLLAAVQLARSEAIKRGVEVSLTAEAGGINEGWCVHVGSSCTGINRVRTFQPTPGLTLALFPQGDTGVAFSARGERVPQEGGDKTILVKPKDCATGATDRQRILTISLSGRASVTRGDC